MAEPKEKPRTRARAKPAAAAQMEAMLKMVSTPEPAPEPKARAKRPARERAVPARGRAVSAAPMAAEQPKPQRYPNRFSLPLTDEQHKALIMARAEDGIEGSYRVRAALSLWLEDDRLRKRIDKLAREESQRDKLTRGYR